jgi:hypothetical protein
VQIKGSKYTIFGTHQHAWFSGLNWVTLRGSKFPNFIVILLNNTLKENFQYVN